MTVVEGGGRGGRRFETESDSEFVPDQLACGDMGVSKGVTMG